MTDRTESCDPRRGAPAEAANRLELSRSDEAGASQPASGRACVAASARWLLGFARATGLQS